MADIFDEVTDELRQDQLKGLWRKYNRFIFFTINFCWFLYLVHSNFMSIVTTKSQWKM